MFRVVNGGTVETFRTRLRGELGERRGGASEAPDADLEIGFVEDCAEGQPEVRRGRLGGKEAASGHDRDARAVSLGGDRDVVDSGGEP